MDEATNKMNNWDEERVSSAESDDAYAAASGSSDDISEDTEQIRADIEDTRAEMSQTINEIQERLSPEHLMGQVKETVREATIGKVERVMNTVVDATEPAREAVGRAGTAIKETGVSVGYSMWRNPIPVALIGLGVGMIVMRSYRGGNGGDYQTRQTTPRPRQYAGGGQTQYGSTYGATTGTGTGTLNQAKETATDLANRSTAALSDLGTKAKDSVSTAGTWLRDNPLAAGAVAVAAGTAVGLALPSTRLESQYVGEASEKLVDKAQDVAREAIHKVQNAAQQMGGEGQQGAGQQGA